MMGNSASSSRSHHDDSVDYGFLTPQGLYTGPRDWNQQIVSQLIIDRRLAPFYRPLEEYEDSWDDEQILAARKVFPEQDAASAEAGTRQDAGGAPLPPSRPSSINSPRRPGSLKDPSRIPEAMVYRDAVECPICFLVRCAVRRLHPPSNSFITSPVLSVLPSEYKPFTLL